LFNLLTQMGTVTLQFISSVSLWHHKLFLIKFHHSYTPKLNNNTT
jgi:hypothetical protein